jgi:hypothetical protein
LVIEVDLVVLIVILAVFVVAVVGIVVEAISISMTVAVVGTTCSSCEEVIGLLGSSYTTTRKENIMNVRITWW